MSSRIHKFSILKKLNFIIIAAFSILPFSSLSSEYEFSIGSDLIEIDEKKINDNQEIYDVQNINDNHYILGSGDVFFLKFEDFPEYSQYVSIQHNGDLYLPKIGNIYAADLLIEELNSLVSKKYNEIMVTPIIEIQLKKRRPIKVLFSGEVARPGLYQVTRDDRQDPSNYATDYYNPQPLTPFKYTDNFYLDSSPTLYEGLRIANGITNETDLENIELRRKIPQKYGGGYKKTNLNLLSIFINGDETNNIKLMDGDVLFFRKSNKSISEQFIQASKYNINPSTIGVYVTGRVQNQGFKSLKYGATLHEAISVAGGLKALRGKIELITSKNDELIVKTYKYDSKRINPKNNPILQTGDIVRVRHSGLSATTELFSEVLPPIMGISAIKNILVGD